MKNDTPLSLLKLILSEVEPECTCHPPHHLPPHCLHCRIKRCLAGMEWSGSRCPCDPDNCWVDDATGEHVSAITGERTTAHDEGQRAEHFLVDDAIGALTTPDYPKLNLHAGRNDRLLHAVLCAYAKHTMGNDDIGWEKLGSILHSVICNEMGDGDYVKWAERITK